jgi:pimeloyl-ACP methyl ester carboxylesterase
VQKKETQMTVEATPAQHEGHYVLADGIDVHYVEAGHSEPLLLLNNAMVSTNPVWARHPFAYGPHKDTLAKHVRVIAPDTRGSGKTVHSGGPITYTLLADDVVALIDALDLYQPLICGFSDGGQTATIVGIRSPESVRAIVNHAGYDLFNPQAPSVAMTRQMLGGSPDATEAGPEAIARICEQSPDLRSMFEMMKSDHDSTQGPGHWEKVIAQTFERITQSPGYAFEDLHTITPPTLILVGDRDQLCAVEEGVTAYRALQDGELSVLPDTGHLIHPGRRAGDDRVPRTSSGQPALIDAGRGLTLDTSVATEAPFAPARADTRTLPPAHVLRLAAANRSAGCVPGRNASVMGSGTGGASGPASSPNRS